MCDISSLNRVATWVSSEICAEHMWTNKVWNTIEIIIPILKIIT